MSPSAAVAKLTASADAYEKALSRVRLKPDATQVRLEPDAGSGTSRAQLAELNRILYSTERAFRHEAGLPKREWFKHLAYAPGFYTGYGVKTLPGIREGIEQEQWDEARSFVPIVAGAIAKLAGEVDRAASLLKQIDR